MYCHLYFWTPGQNFVRTCSWTLFIHLFNIYLLSTYHGPDTVLDIVAEQWTKEIKFSALPGAKNLAEETISKKS